MLTDELKDKLKETIEELNLLPEEVEKLSTIWSKLKAYARKRLSK